LQAFGGGLAAPSANRFGRISPTTATAVYEELGDAVDVILDGGQCEVGLESTIVDISGDEPVILRPGMITTSQISAVLHQDVYASQKNSPRVSGSLASHYAPQTKTLLVATTKISEWVNNISAENLPIVLLSYSHDQIVRPGIEWVTMPANPRQYAHDLYLRLRELDKNHFKQIVIESVPSDREWDAVRDRLQRASFNN
jgi:L-threonylcarbamoyladenylate synthase